MVLHVHATSNTLGGSYRPVLLEGPSAIDGRLIGTGGNRDIVGAAIGLEATLTLRTAAGVVGTVGFDHIVLDKRVASPAVHSKVAVTRGVERATVVDGASIWSACGGG
jgi:hypothetical protein